MSGTREKTARRKAFLRKRDGDNCSICGLVMRFDGRTDKSPARLDASIDHVQPRSEGGSSLWSNLRLAHQQCNSSRHMPSFTEDRIREEMIPLVCTWLLGLGQRRRPRPRHVLAYVVALDSEIS